MMYGYRYKPGGHVIALPALCYDDAAEAVIGHRRKQSKRNTPQTAELVERDNDGDEWQFVPLPDTEAAE